MVATSRGWLVAYDTVSAGGASSRLFVQRFDREANPDGAPLVFENGTDPKLTRGDGSSILLEYQLPYARTGYPVAAALFAGDGSMRVSPREVLQGTYGLDHESAVWVGDAFLLSGRSFDGRVDATQIVRLERDGAVSARTQPVGTSTEYAQLTWDGARAGMLYGNFSGTAAMYWQWLDARGAAMGAPAPLASVLPTFGVAYPTVLGPASYYVLRSAGEDRLEGARVDGALRAAGAFAAVGRGGSFGSNDRVRTARAGTRLIVAWTASTSGGARTLGAGLVTP